MEATSTSSFVSHALVALFFMLQVLACAAVRPASSTETNTEFLKTSCSTTRYPQLCFNSLSGYACKIQTSPKLLAHAALAVTLTAARSASSAVANLSKAPGLKAPEAAAMSDCVEEVGDAVDELRKSMAEMGQNGTDPSLQISNIQTWVSAALTDEDTCMDGFAGSAMNGNVKTTVRGHILYIAHLTSNALALVNNYASAQNFSP